MGRRPTHPQVVESAPPWVTVATVAATIPASRWHRLAVQDGEKGPITYDWARLRVVERVDGLPSRTVWLLVRRSVTDPTEVKYFLSNAPTTVTLPTLARVASTRFAVEQCFEEAKGQAGLDEYEVRLWSSWHRHITLTMMAHAWLTVVRAEVRWRLPPLRPKKGAEVALAELTVPEVRRLIEIAVPLRERTRVQQLNWSLYRRRKRYWARESHYRRRNAQHQALPRGA